MPVTASVLVLLQGRPIAEVSRLGCSLRQWGEQILAYCATGGVNNGSTEAINLLNRTLTTAGPLHGAKVTHRSTGFRLLERADQDVGVDRPSHLQSERLAHFSGTPSWVR